MSGYVTSKRDKPLVRGVAKGNYGYDQINTDLSTYYPSLNQTTESFRGSPDLEIAPDGTLTIPKDEVRGKYDNGHNFLTRRDHFAGDLKNYRIYNPDSESVWRYGPLAPFQGAVDPQTSLSLNTAENILPSYSQSELNALGSKAIAESNPLRPNANLAQFVGELGEGLPTLVFSTIKDLKKRNPFANAGGDYLNYQFGLKPMISDLKNMLRSVLRSTEIIQWVIDHSDKPVYGRFGFPQEETVKSYTSDNPYYTVMPFGGWSQSQYTALLNKRPIHSTVLVKTHSTLKRTRSAWFRGSYIYHLANGSDLLSKAKAYEQLANKLLGTRITPSTLWELTPWSWLIDWQFDIGDVLSNISNFSGDGLVLRYGYLMDYTRWDVTVVAENPGYLGTPNEFVSHLWRTQKRRTRANPYGFGISPGSFSESQWAILGALGMTKTPRSLR